MKPEPMTQVFTEIERTRRAELMRDTKAALKQGLSLDQYLVGRNQAVDEWTRWFHAEMDKCRATDPIEVLPQALACVQEHAIAEARRTAEAAARDVVMAILRRAIT
jgi:hypothetical protein